MHPVIDIVIETPAGSGIKYVYDFSRNMLRVKKKLAQGLVFPWDFGFIPGTLGEDGDPLDVMVISEFSAIPGAMLEVRLIGCIRVMQQKNAAPDGPVRMIRNDRYLAVPRLSTEYAAVEDVNELPDDLVQGVATFIGDYMRAEGKQVLIEGIWNADAANEEAAAGKAAASPDR